MNNIEETIKQMLELPDEVLKEAWLILNKNLTVDEQLYFKETNVRFMIKKGFFSFEDFIYFYTFLQSKLPQDTLQFPSNEIKLEEYNN